MILAVHWVADNSVEIEELTYLSGNLSAWEQIWELDRIGCSELERPQCRM